MTIVFGDDPVVRSINAALDLLESGTWDDAESTCVDLKEEAGRRDGSGRLLPGEPWNERAASQVSGEAACMANTPGGGALILGVADNGALIGTALDPEWLRARVYELTNRALTIDIRETRVHDARLLVITAPQAVEPIRWKGKITWRVSDRCVEIDVASWHARRSAYSGYDWSASPSHVSADEVRAGAVEVAREFLLNSGDERSVQLAQEPTPSLLRRLNVVTGDENLTNAGVLAFVGRSEPALDYTYRDFAGGDSRARVNRGRRGLLEELQEAFTHFTARNDIHHLPRGIASGQISDIPASAAREAMVNGVAHRDWASPHSVVVEHIGRTLRVTSPGGFYGGVNAENIITHPSQPRNRALAELLASLRIAEREGVGVDRMIGSMVRYGHPRPLFDELVGPFVRASLVGDMTDVSWIQWISDILPGAHSDDVSLLLLLRRLVDQAWLDIASSAPDLQLNSAETAGAIERLFDATSPHDVVQHVAGVPAGEPTAWTLTASARKRLADLDTELGQRREWPARPQIARTYAAARGRISTTELAAMVGSYASNVGGVLQELEQDGELTPSRASRRGRGFFYRYNEAPDRGEPPLT